MEVGFVPPLSECSLSLLGVSCCPVVLSCVKGASSGVNVTQSDSQSVILVSKELFPPRKPCDFSLRQRIASDRGCVCDFFEKKSLHCRNVWLDGDICDKKPQ